MGQLVAALHLPGPTATRVVDGPVDAALAYRLPDPADGRRVVVHPSALGRTRLARWEALVAAQEAALARSLGEDRVGGAGAGADRARRGSACARRPLKPQVGGAPYGRRGGAVRMTRAHVRSGAPAACSGAGRPVPQQRSARSSRVMPDVRRCRHVRDQPSAQHLAAGPLPGREAVIPLPGRVLAGVRWWMPGGR